MGWPAPFRLTLRSMPCSLWLVVVRLVTVCSWHLPAKRVGDRPIHAFGGSDDPLVSEDDLGEWRSRTSAEFSVQVFDGGHFYLTDATDLFACLRPMLAKNRELPQRKFGWWFRLLEGHSRWETFELVKPMKSGDEAPAIALPRIGEGGALGDRVTLEASRGRITVLDFWATWCKPCLAGMPRLDQLARANPDIAVIAVNV